MRRDHATRRPATRRETGWKARPTVEGIEKRVLLANFIVTSSADDPMAMNPNSLRSIIVQSNLMGGTNNITFNLTAAGGRTINLTKALPAITTPTTIDASSLVAGGVPQVVLNGSGISGGSDGLDLTAGSSAVIGLGIVGFSGEGISLTKAGGDMISSDYIGVGTTGTAAGNGADGIGIGSGSDGNTVSDNLISGNAGYGILLDGTFGGTATDTASGNTIVGNTIGSNAGGTLVLPNKSGGILVRNAPNSTIGGDTDADRNVVSGNTFTVSASGVQTGTGDGIDVYAGSGGTTIVGNDIGTNSAGSAALANQGSGITLHGADSLTIGGTTGNLISGNQSDGIDGSTNFGSTLTIQGNDIGTDVNGTQAVGNLGDGINLDSEGTTLIGGTGAATTRNVISANGGNGLTLSGGGQTQVEGNYVGVGSAGITMLGNGATGIEADSDSVQVGGQSPTSDTTFANLIANNANGVVSASPDFFGVGAPVTFNSIYGNTTLGIANNTFGATAAPVVTSAVSMTDTSRINGSLTADAGTYLLQFFSSPGRTVPSNPQGQTYLGSYSFTSGGGTSTFSAPLMTGINLPAYVTATATPTDDGNTTFEGGTSGFSNGVRATGSGPTNAPPVLSVSSTPTTVNAGDNVTYTFTIANNSASDDDGVVFNDPIPAGATFFSTGSTTSTGAPVVLTSGTASAQIGALAAGDSVTVTIVLTTGGGSVPSFTNTADVTATTPTVDAGTDTITSQATTVIAAADLAVQVVGQPASVPVGQTITYTVTISNYGPSDATNVKLTDTLPTNTTFVSASTSSTNASDAPSNSGDQVTATVASLPSGDVVTYTITALTNGTTPTSVSDTATVAGDQVDPDTSTNTASATTTVVPSADLAVAGESISSAAVVAGSPVTFTINLVNNGPSPATGVKLSDILPAGLTFVSGTAVGGAVTVSNGVVTAPVGALAVGGTSTVTITALTGPAGTFSDAATVSSADGDPNSTNNTGSASVTVSPVTDLAVVLAGPATLNTGNPLTYTATITNAGPSPATNSVFSLPLLAGATFESATVNGTSGGTVTNNILSEVLGSIAAGQTVTIIVTEIPTVAGTVTSTAVVSTDEPDANPANNTSSVTTVLSVPNPIIAFTAAQYTANETDGSAPITLTRIGDTSGTLTVHFSTVAGGNATPGLDYTPISTTVTFLPGQTSATVNVPVLADPYDRTNEFVALQLDTPTNASLPNGAATAISGLEIINLDPVTVGPTVTDLKLYGPTSSITGIEVDTTGNLNPTTASNAANYTILALGGGSLAYGTSIPVSQAAYDAATGAVLLIPSRPLPANELFLVVVNGTTATAVTDLAGNPLNSTFGVTAGSNYALTVARGTNLHYTDENGAQVNLKLSGPGTLDLDRSIGGEVELLQILGATKKTSLTGSVSPKGHRSNIGVITGIGRFGTVLTHLYSPPFTVSNATFPNPANLVNYPSVDVLTPSATTTTSTTKSTKKTVSAKAITVSTGAKLHHAASVHPAHKRATR